MPNNIVDIKDFADDLNYRKQFWRPRDMRMDRWYLMYRLIDAFQAAKPVQRKRFISNEPQTTIDRAESIIARNPVQWQIHMETLENDEESATVEQIEHLLVGVMNQVDKDLIKRGHKRARRIAAQHALLRGWIAYSLTLSKDSGSSKRKSAINYHPYDPRFVYPRYDDEGLHSVMCEDEIFAGEILKNYPEAAAKLGITRNDNLMQTFTWYKYLDREVEGIAASHTLDAVLRRDNAPICWLKPPEAHGRDDIPFGLIPVHGVETRYMPVLPDPYQRDMTPRQMHQLATPKDYMRLPTSWSADVGRSILSAVEDTVPQFNDLVATIWQIAANNAFGTWVIRSRGGKHVPFRDGDNVVNFMDLAESVQRFGGDVAPPDLGTVSNLLGSQIQRGTLSYALFGDSEFNGSGFLFSQVEEAALNAIDDWRDSVKLWAESFADDFMEEYRYEGGHKALKVQGRDSKNRMFLEEVDPKTIKKTYFIEAELRPALPSDMMQRVQMARLLLDPRRPIASLQTVFDKVLNWPDAKGELDRIFEDIAYTDPLIVMERVARVLEQRGAEEFAQVLREKAWQQQAMQNMQFEAMSMQMGAMTGQVPPGQSPPENMGTTEGAAPTPAGGAQPGVGGAGQAGYTNGA